jgi:hypothetical protein
MIRALHLSALALVLLLAPSLWASATAHQQKIALTSIAHNDRTGLLEVIHRVPLHDAEHALEAQGVRAPDIDLESRRVAHRPPALNTQRFAYFTVRTNLLRPSLRT